MTGLFARGCLKKVKRSKRPMGTRVISSRFHYKIKRHSAGEHKLKVKRLKVRLVVQGQHMSKDKGDFTNAFSPGPHLSGVRCCMSMATAMKWSISGLEASVRHAAFWQVSARHMVELAREPRFPEGRIRGCSDNDDPFYGIIY
jgi:hypothetical protein